MKNFIIIFFFFFINFPVNAELLKPSPLLDPKQVILIQLSALTNNNIPYKNFGIKQTWEFAHPSNKKYTGPLNNFTKMMYSANYEKMINHKKHNVNQIAISENLAMFFVIILDTYGAKYGFNWIVEKVKIQGDFYNCWMTSSVSPPLKYGEDT